MNNTDVNVGVKASLHQGSLLQSKKRVSGEISKEPFLDILLTNVEQSSFSLGYKKLGFIDAFTEILQNIETPRREIRLTNLRTSCYLFGVKEPSLGLRKTDFDKLKLSSLQPSILFKREPELCEKRTSKNSFLKENRHILYIVKIGDYVHSGDKIGYFFHTPIVISESGKILRISQAQITLQKMQPVLFYSQAEIHVESNEWVKRGTPLLTLAHQTLVTGDIVQGIPRIEQLFEASTAAPPGAALQDFGGRSNDVTGTKFRHSLKKSSINDFFKSRQSSHLLPLADDLTGYQNKKRLSQSKDFTPQNRNKEELSLQSNKKVSDDKNANSSTTFQRRDNRTLLENGEKGDLALKKQNFVTATEEQPLLLYKTLQSQVRETFRKKWDQLPLPAAVRQSLEEIQQIIVESIQKVYISQGVLIADKHIEIIVRQMSSKAQIFDGGSTGLFIDEILSLQEIENANISTPGQKALYLPVVMGLTRAALSSDSFVSAASFQETTRVLSRDAVAGKTDFLRGLKEKVIIGDLIDAGTGLDAFYVYSLFSKKIFSIQLRKIFNQKVTHKTLKKLVFTVVKD